MFDLKVINSVLDQMEEERGVERAKMIDAIEQALATAYKKEFGQRGQIIRAEFDITTGDVVFNQIKIVADETTVRMDEDEEEDETEGEKPERDERVDTEEAEGDDDDPRVRFDAEKHILIENAKLIKKDVEVGDEMIFPLEPKDDFGRIAAQTAKQVIIQKIREAEKESALTEFGQKAGDIIIGHVQRFERGNLYVDLGRVTGVMPYDEQIPGERFRPGERVRALLVSVEETARGIFLRLSRSHPDFLAKLFEVEAPELQSGSVEIKSVAREAGSRSKIAVIAHDDHIDPVGSMVGQRGVRVSTVMSELGGEKIDVIEWSEDPVEFIEDALSPAQIVKVEILQEPTDANEDVGEKGGGERGHAEVTVASDQQSLAIGRGGQNVRLAAKLTGWKIDIVSTGEPVGDDVDEDESILESEDATTSKEELVEDEPTKDRDSTPDSEEEDPIDTPEEAEEALAEAEDTPEENPEEKIEEEK